MRPFPTFGTLCASAWCLIQLGQLGLMPVVAAAQEPPASRPSSDEEVIPDPNIPDTPLRSVYSQQSDESVTAVRYTKDTYPIEIIKRPLTLIQNMAQISLEVPFVSNGGNPTLTQIIRAQFGITNRFELGLTYSVGLEQLSAPAGVDGFTAGKAVSIDPAYTILPDHLAARLRLGLFADSKDVGFGVVLDAPFRVTLTDQWALIGGQDFIHLKIKRLAVDAADPAGNLDAIAFEAKGGDPDSGSLNLNFGALYQARPNVALEAMFGIGFPDFSSSNQPIAFFFSSIWSPVRRIDLSARIGFGDMGHASDTFTIALLGAARF